MVSVVNNVCPLQSFGNAMLQCISHLAVQSDFQLDAKKLRTKDDIALLLTHQKGLRGMYTEAEQKKLQKQWDKETPVVPLLQILTKNSPEWWMIALGLVGSMVAGAVTPIFSIFFGKILGVFAGPPETVLSKIHPWAGLFLVLAFATGMANFLKVHLCAQYHVSVTV